VIFILRIAIVDDERECRTQAAQFCKDFGASAGYSVEILGFSSGGAFLKALEKESFSIVFMDIFMDGTDGIATALNMRSLNHQCLLVFLTASTEFMPNAFSCHAFEYITKPFSCQRIFNVLKDAVKILPEMQKYIALISGRTTVHVPVDEIVSVITDAHYLIIDLANAKKLRCRMTMARFLENTENDARFIPVNKGITVNAEYILAFENNCCILENGAQFPVRVRDGLKVQQAVQDYNFLRIRQRQTHSARRHSSQCPGKED
jgi:Response regulator of the LytR/AlgR family